MSDYGTRGDLREGYREWLRELLDEAQDLVVHFVFNRAVSAIAMERALDEFLQRLDRYCLGVRFHKKAWSSRSSIIVFTEHAASNRHGHGFLRPGILKDGDTAADLRAEAARIWKVLEPAGNLDIRPADAMEAAIIYNTKDLAQSGAADLIYVRGVFLKR